MKLKSIEINGFKSFADKVKVDFEDDVTAIIGPNGSGKSNISDAVRWVLGEQSAKMLRGSKMEDVIFSGTDEKSPKNYAQVTIIFDNSSGMIPIEFKEVSVSRKLFRSGESEYFINKSNVRLKEIKELFLDTGVGKEGYSIISQGRIEEIVNGKAEDRRAIFDEASGIAKIKYKKTESERKLERTKDNLVRLKDIILQNENRHSYLKVQSEKAKKAKILIGNIEKIEFSQSYSQYNSLKLKIADLKTDLELKSKKFNKLSEDRNKFEEDLAPIKDIFTEKNLALEKNNIEYENLVKLSSEYKNKSDILVERNSNLELNTDTFEKSLVEISDNISNIDKQLEEKDAVISSKREESKTHLAKLNEVKTEINTLKNEISVLDRNILKSEEEKKDITDTISLLESEKKAIELFKEQNIQLKKENELEILKLVDEKNNLEDENLKDIENLKNLHLEIENLEKSYDLLKENRNTLINDRTLELNAIDLIKNQIIFKEKEYELINNHIKNYDGYNRSIQDLIKLSQRDELIKKMICGVFGELISVDEKYKKAIDTVLSSNLQGVVVENEHNAKFLIEKMKINKISRINFFPITKIKASFVEKNVIDSDILSFANEVVSCDNVYRNIVDYFLNKTIICENMDIAIKLSNKYKSKYRIVTLDGDVISTWGSISGGYKSTKNSHSILGRKEQLKSIGKEIESLKSEVVEKNENISKIVAEIQKIESELVENKNNYTEKSSISLKLKEEISKNNLRYEFLVDSIEKLSNSGERDSNFKEVDENTLLQLKKDFEELENSIEKLNDERKILFEKLTELEKEEYRINNDVELFERDINLVLNSKYDLIENKTANESRLHSIKSDLQKYGTDLVENKRLIEEYNSKFIESEEKISNFKDVIVTLKEELKVLDEKYSTLNENLSNVKLEIISLEKDVESISSKISMYSNEHSNIITYLCEEYAIDEKQCEIYMEKYKDESGSKAELKKLKQDLRDIGSFSYDSIEEFEKVDEELTFQKAQEVDLNNAISDINSILKKLESEMKTAFAKEFELINKNFSEIFSKLFNGGEARLELDGDNILTAGIEIIARPLGKKMQSLSLMSGGEKSLTAIALLFAIFETRPSPFCLLDEIDASLDDSNILRYTNYLKKFFGDVQFIMITHRKPTMEMANTLYGVTMEQKGVSKIISMKFDS